jgi:hypothetical protein
MSSISSGVKRFTQLVDVPQSYTGLGNRIVSVKGTENGLETVAQSVGPVSTFLALSDTPGSYAGAGGQHVEVNTAENALIFGYFNIRNQAIDAVVVSGDYTIIMDASGGNRTITIPSAVTNSGRILNFKKSDNSVNTVLINPLIAGQTIDGVSTYRLTVQYQTVTIQSDGTNWYII